MNAKDSQFHFDLERERSFQAHGEEKEMNLQPKSETKRQSTLARGKRGLNLTSSTREPQSSH